MADEGKKQTQKKIRAISGLLFTFYTSSITITMSTWAYIAHSIQTHTVPEPSHIK